MSFSEFPHSQLHEKKSAKANTGATLREVQASREIAQKGVGSYADCIHDRFELPSCAILHRPVRGGWLARDSTGAARSAQRCGTHSQPNSRRKFSAQRGKIPQTLGIYTPKTHQARLRTKPRGCTSVAAVRVSRHRAARLSGGCRNPLG